ncbi:MAG: apolipoprotein N-acyltransferase [Candidatus Planktophila sp.]|nr:apolipoprotein N-acyltransferase [Candidatus Planktophila sp.]
MVNALLAILSGALLSCAFEPVGKWWLAPLAIATHMYAISRTQHKKTSAFLFALCFNLFTLHWTSTFVGSTPWIILAVGLSLFYLPLALIGRWGIASYPLIFIILEEVRNHFPFGGFGWARLAYSQPDSIYSQIASRGGAIALSAITVLIGAFIFFVCHAKIKPILLLPFFLLLIPNNISTVGTTSALLIQGNVPELGLDFNSRAKEVFNNHVIETGKGLADNGRIDFIVWPENAVDVDPFTNADVFAQLEAFEQPLIIGAIVRKDGKLLNTSILWDDTNQEIYVKQHLTPFGEYIPLRFIASKLSPLVNRVNDFAPGDKGKVFDIGAARVAPVICFELIDDQILHAAAKSSNLFVVQTNSATFGESPESAQQLSITRVRAIEHSRNVLSVSTTGYSAVIDFKGKVVQQTSMATAQHLYASVGLIDQNSVRDKVGDWASVGTLFWMFLVARRMRE